MGTAQRRDAPTGCPRALRAAWAPEETGSGFCPPPRDDGHFPECPGLLVAPRATRQAAPTSGNDGLETTKVIVHLRRPAAAPDVGCTCRLTGLPPDGVRSAPATPGRAMGNGRGSPGPGFPETQEKKRPETPIKRPRPLPERGRLRVHARRAYTHSPGARPAPRQSTAPSAPRANARDRRGSAPHRPFMRRCRRTSVGLSQGGGT